MSKNSYIIPEQCKNCGALFDLWYDFAEKENFYIEEAREKLGKKLSEYLCWSCKKQMVEDLVNRKEDIEESTSEEDLLLDWDYE